METALPTTPSHKGIARSTAKFSSGFPHAFHASSRGSPGVLKKDLREAWIDLLEPYRWQWFATFTFRPRCYHEITVHPRRRRPPIDHGLVHPEHADKLFRLLVSMAN